MNPIKTVYMQWLQFYYVLIPFFTYPLIAPLQLVVDVDWQEFRGLLVQIDEVLKVRGDILLESLIILKGILLEFVKHILEVQKFLFWVKLL